MRKKANDKAEEYKKKMEKNNKKDGDLDEEGDE